MNQQQGMQVQLPENVTLHLKTQDVITILGALGEYGPHKAVNPVIMNLEQQLLSQQIKPKYQGPPPGAPTPPPPVDNAHVAPGCELFEDPRQPGIDNDVLQVISHHPV